MIGGEQNAHRGLNQSRRTSGFWAASSSDKAHVTASSSDLSPCRKSVGGNVSANGYFPKPSFPRASTAGAELRVEATLGWAYRTVKPMRFPELRFGPDP